MAASDSTKRVLITGANRGIGREVALELGRRGLHVVVAARRMAAAEEVVAAIRSAGGQADSLEVDVSDSASIAAAASAVVDHYRTLDVLVNNAGIYPDKEFTALTAPRELLAKTFQTNTFGPLEMVQRLLPALRAAGAARVINISSGYGQLSRLSSEAATYCLSKLALNGVTIILAKDLAADGIAVNSVRPGWVRTDMGGAEAARSVEEGADTPVWLATEADQTLTGRFFRDRQEIPW